MLFVACSREGLRRHRSQYPGRGRGRGHLLVNSCRHLAIQTFAPSIARPMEQHRPVAGGNCAAPTEASRGERLRPDLRSGPAVLEGSSLSQVATTARPDCQRQIAAAAEGGDQGSISSRNASAGRPISVAVSAQKCRPRASVFGSPGWHVAIHSSSRPSSATGGIDGGRGRGRCPSCG